MKRCFALICLAGGAQGAFAAYTYTSFNASQWAASDATLGVSGYSIEDFEDVNLIAGFQLSVTSGNGGYGPTSVLPNTFNPFTDSTQGTAFQFGGGGAWDGTRGVINTRTNREFPYGEPASWGFTTFHFANPARSVGFSVQQLDLEGELWINGAFEGNLTALSGWAANGLRQGYIRVDGTGTSTISTIQIRNGFNGSFGDGIMFDHVAFSSVPEPGTMAVLGLGVAALIRRRRTRR